MSGKDELRLIMVGKTGVGKSSTGNSILGAKVFLQGVGARSVTVHSSYGRATRVGRKVLVVDSPGLYDTETSQGQTEMEIAKFLMIAAPGPHAILMIISAAARFTEEEAATLNRLKQLFGEDMMRYLIVIVTRGDELVRGSMGVKEYVDFSPPLLKSIVAQAGNRVISFDNYAQGPKADSQVEALFALVENTVRQNGGNHYTPQMFEAAAELMRQREEELRLQQEEEQRRIRKEMEEEARQKVEAELAEMRAQLEEETRRRVAEMEAKTARKLQGLEGERRRLAETEARYEQMMNRIRDEELEKQILQQQGQERRPTNGRQPVYVLDLAFGTHMMNAKR